MGRTSQRVAAPTQPNLQIIAALAPPALLVALAVALLTAASVEAAPRPGAAPEQETPQRAEITCILYAHDASPR